MLAGRFAWCNVRPTPYLTGKNTNADETVARTMALRAGPPRVGGPRRRIWLLAGIACPDVAGFSRR